MLGLPHTLPVNLTHILLRGCNSKAIYGMKGMLPVPISSFPFPTYYPDTGTGSCYLDRT
jgi:hypothetical protein